MIKDYFPRVSQEWLRSFSLCGGVLLSTQFLGKRLCCCFVGGGGVFSPHERQADVNKER